MFELQLDIVANRRANEGSYRLGMFELQPGRVSLNAILFVVIAWACLSCNATD